MITLYSKPNCVQCTATERKLVESGKRYRKVDVTEDQKAYEFVTGMGYQQVPVVVVGFEHKELGGQHWSGYNPDMIAKL